MFIPLILTLASALPLDVSAATTVPSNAIYGPPVAIETTTDELAVSPSIEESIEVTPKLDTDFNYNYAYGGLSSGAATGLRLGGSYALSGPWVVIGQFDYLIQDGSYLGIDYTSLSAGAGYVYPYSQNLNLIGTLELEYGRLKAGLGQFSASDSEVGVKGRVGARYALESNLELYGGAGFRTLFNGDFVLDGGALYQLSDSLSAFVELEYSDLSLFSLGIRYSL